MGIFSMFEIQVSHWATGVGLACRRVPHAHYCRGTSLPLCFEACTISPVLQLNSRSASAESPSYSMHVVQEEKVSFQIADQIINYLKKGAIVNALNAPSIDPKEALLLNPWIRLAKILGSFIGQILDSPILDIEIEYVGKVGELNFKPISSGIFD